MTRVSTNDGRVGGSMRSNRMSQPTSTVGTAVTGTIHENDVAGPGVRDLDVRLDPVGACRRVGVQHEQHVLRGLRDRQRAVGRRSVAEEPTARARLAGANRRDRQRAENVSRNP